MRHSLFVAFFLGTGVFLIDQFSKFLFANQVEINRGISFGIELPTWLVLFLSVIVLGFISFVLKKRPLLMSVVMGAGISNFFDRIQYGGVRDWLQLPLFGIRNNIADWIIVLGLGWWIWIEMGNSRRKKV
jgi:lipoprotein signal peptidase